MSAQAVKNQEESDSKRAISRRNKETHTEEGQMATRICKTRMDERLCGDSSLDLWGGDCDACAISENCLYLVGICDHEFTVDA